MPMGLSWSPETGRAQVGPIGEEAIESTVKPSKTEPEVVGRRGSQAESTAMLARVEGKR